MNYLSNKGLDISRLRYAGYGETSPLGDNETEEGRVLNRRTELRIISQ
jgi:outer membrane protein OmpA-like peptidoglycan-associated protein